MMLTITLIFILVAALCVLWALKKQDELSELKEELDKYSLHLDERANRLAADEQTTIALNMRLREEIKRRQEWKVLQAAFAVSELDDIKFNSEEEIFNSVRRVLASAIAEEIVRNFPKPAKEDGADGIHRYVYRLKVTPAYGEHYSRQ